MKKQTTKQWLESHVNFDGDDCLIWPFNTHPNGRGMFGTRKGGKAVTLWAHRYMCELVNGPQPSPEHECAHNCGQGHRGCVDPRHLAWKTKTENQRDRALHGTRSLGGYRGWRKKLTVEKVAEIKKLRGRETQLSLAARFGVTDKTIRDVFNGKTWKHVS